MSGKLKILQKIKEKKIVAVIRATDANKAKKISNAVKMGGVDIIEITMTVPGALDVIKELTNTFSSDKITIGAGSVLDAETARSCILAGAEFIVGPTLNEETIKMANRYQKPIMPGAMSVTEVQKAMEAGADVVKIFPSSLFGPKIVRAIKGPLPQAPLLPTGGVNLDNVAEWIKAGSFAVGVGGALVAGAKEGDFDKITETAKEFIKRIEIAREEL